MYIIRNALRNIMRSKARNVLIGLIVLVIATSSCVALSIKQSAAKAQTEGLEALTITGQITVDRSAMFKKMESGDRKSIREQLGAVSQLSLEEMQAYAKAPSVSDFYYTVTSSVDAGSELFEPVDTDTSSDTGDAASSATNANDKTPPGGMGGGRDIPGGMGAQGDFSVIGYSAETAMTDFQSGVCKISDGSMIDLTSADLKCLITGELATYNELKAGDTIKLANPNAEDEVYTLTVSGIYTNSNSGSTENGMRFSTANDPANQIITSVGALKAIADKSTSVAETSTDETTGRTSTTALRTQMNGIYVFADVDAFEQFQTQVYDWGLDDTYTVTSSDMDTYEQSLLPLQNLSKFAGIFLLVVLLIGGIILVVLNIFNIRERKYEVGVLTAIGMKKGKVALQFVLEVFTVTLASIVIGTIIGAVVSVPTANALLKTQVSAQQSQTQRVDANFGRGSDGGTAPDGMNGGGKQGGFGGFMNEARGRVVNYVSDVNASTDFTVILELLGIGVLLTLVASGAAIVSIIRYEPLKILTSRT